MTEESSQKSEPSSTTRIIGRNAGALFDLGLTPATPLDEDQFQTQEHEIISPGQMVGRYRIMSKLGEGGFGAVWLAEQTGLSKMVALKLIKPGMDSRQVIQRFEAERHTLTLMSHPNIAAVLDAGTTPQGHPFFVMELVHGVAITKYCDRQKLSLVERLRLFQHVCQAVHHAHQKAILHRDIKPSNILVGKGDTESVAKVIDFGIAKALSSSPKAGADSATFTGMGTFLGTPPYMSPEQAGAGVDVDTRSDIYALGAVLYELLTGRTHIPLERFRDASLQQMVSAIQDAEPVRPSLLFQNPPDQEKAARSSEARGSDPRTLAENLRGDLDWIVLKAIEKDRTRRYESAAALSDDIERHLRDQPVIARPPSRIYVLGKLVRRNRAAVIAAILSVLALVAGSTAAFIGFVQAREALDQSRKSEQLARDETKKSRELLGFMIGLFKDFDQGTISTKLFRELLNTTDERRKKELLDPNQKEADMEISGILALGFSGLDDPARAEHLHLHRHARLRELGRGSSKEAAECLFQAVWARHQQAQNMVVDTFLERDREMLAECLAIQKSIRPAIPEDIVLTEALMAALSIRGGKLDEAKARLDAVVKAGPEHQYHGWILRERALIAQKEKRYDEAARLLGLAQASFSRTNPSTRVRLQGEAAFNHLFTNMHLASGALEDAEVSAKEEWRLREQWLEEVPYALILRVADIQARLKRPLDAEETLAKIVERAQSTNTAFPEYESALRKLVTIGRTHRKINDPFILDSTGRLAKLLLTRADQAVYAGHAEQAERDLADCARVLDSHFLAPFESPVYGYSMHSLRAGLLARQHKDEDAIADYAKAAAYDPGDLSLRLKMCLLMIRKGDLPAYQTERGLLLKHLTATPGVGGAQEPDFLQMLPVWRAMLLRPGLGEADLQRLRDSVERMPVRSQRSNMSRSKNEADGAGGDSEESGSSFHGDLRDGWTALLRALAHFRSGQNKKASAPKEAEAAFKEAEALLLLLASSRETVIVVQTDLLNAMNEYELKLPHAKDSWQKAVRQFDAEYARYEGTDSNPPMEDHLSARLLREEGEALFEKAAVRKP
jgi:serine/threonine protein kinase